MNKSQHYDKIGMAWMIVAVICFANEFYISGTFSLLLFGLLFLASIGVDDD